MASHERTLRVAMVIQEEVGKLLARGLKDPRIGFVTITAVEISPDLREAKVFYATHGSAGEQAATGEGLHAAAGWLRRQLGPHLRIKSIPHLTFVFDESIDRGDRINQLLQQIKPAAAAEDEEAAEPDTEPT
jgi:ribosome-binding factor A